MWLSYLAFEIVSGIFLVLGALRFLKDWISIFVCWMDRCLCFIILPNWNDFLHHFCCCNHLIGVITQATSLSRIARLSLPSNTTHWMSSHGFNGAARMLAFTSSNWKPISTASFLHQWDCVGFLNRILNQEGMC